MMLTLKDFIKNSYLPYLLTKRPEIPFIRQSVSIIVTVRQGDFKGKRGGFLLLTRLEVLNHSIYETLHLFFTIRWLRKANPCFIMRYVEFCLFLGKFTMVNIIEYIEVNL